jgi:hypothetical protein
MSGMKTKLTVVKADGTVEEYLHTKIIGTISNALLSADYPDINVAEQLAEVVTYYLYHKQNRNSVTSGEIFSAIKAVLAGTKYEDAAVTLNEYHYQRKLKRDRIEVSPIDICELADAEQLCADENIGDRSHWDKSIIVSDLMKKYHIERQSARTIASIVEEKIFSMGISVAPVSLIKQLVFSAAALVLRAESQLQIV